MKHLIYIVAFCLGFLNFAQNKVLFEEANKLYNEGKYAEAIDKYSAILDSGEHSAALYFNLANANYKLSNIAPSIYYYEKALQLAPNDSDIQNNIVFARNMTVDAIDVIPESGISKLVKSISNVFSFDTWAILAVVMAFIFVVLFVLYYFSFVSQIKRLFFISSFLILILLITCLSFAFYQYNLKQNDNPAIVFAQESSAKSEPNLRSEEAFRIHEGTKLQVLETIGDWKKIKLADGKKGWISSSDIKMLNDL